jgi:hypothetical protein
MSDVSTDSMFSPFSKFWLKLELVTAFFRLFTVILLLREDEASKGSGRASTDFTDVRHWVELSEGWI